MINTFIGDLGHLSVIVAFVTAIVAALAYFMASFRQPLGQVNTEWRNLGRGAFVLHAVAVLGIIISLFDIIYNHRYEYHYAWSHSSNHLPTHYMISCFWEGQEGSFLLWIFWHVVLGLIIMKNNRKWEAPAMAVFAFVQLFLTSMILGVVIGDLKIGSSPFLLLRDFMTDAPVFKMNPNFIPKDGTGLNPLLQNYWMVIHPPTLFLGFASTLVPFAFAIAALWKGEYREWLKPAFPWALFAAMILGVGTIMGAYWAYETLNFGGYWNWDPVENAVYIPWLIMIGAAHTMVMYKRSKTALRTTFLLVITTFLLVLYATFLTRSGILGNASVHSFTDLGLSGQLFAYLAAFVVLAVALIIYRWKAIPATQKELTTYSSELWVFIGAAVLCLGAFQVIVTTSIPVYNSFMGFIGFKTNAALPADQIAHYTKFQLWVGVGIGLLSGFAQVLWWRKTEKESLSNLLAIPLILTFLFAALILLAGKMGWMPAIDVTKKPQYVLFLVGALFAVFSNLGTMVALLQKKVVLSGGAIAHIGVAMILLGILYSAGYSKVVSQNMSGLLYSREFSEEMNRDNVLLWRNQTTEMGGYKVTYKGQFLEVKDMPKYVNKQLLFETADEYKALARADLKIGDKTYFKTGDTVEVYPENTYYQVEYQEKNGNKKFTLWPRAQVNPEMGLLASPDIKSFAAGDLYTHVSSIPKPDEEKEWSPVKESLIGIKDTIFINDYVAVLYGLEKATHVQGVDLNLAEGDVAVQADMKIFGEKKEYHVHPVFVIKDKLVGRIPDEVDDLGVRITFNNIDPVNNKFSFSVQTTQKDYVILKAMEKPFINVMWIGVFVMTAGFIIAILRRKREANEADDNSRPQTQAKQRKMVA
jgi:cytochrome c-type biogenesis protein CcmF